MITVGSVDIGGTKIAVGAVREDGAILARHECKTEPEKGFHNAMQRIIEMLRAISAEGLQFKGIGVGCPGPLSPTTGVIEEVGTLPSWQGGNLLVELEAGMNLPVVVENDADAAALGEARWGSDASDGTFIYVTISTGIGGGILFGGHLYRGVDGAHPEIGHQVLDDSGRPCYCGARGCWESLASGPAMTRWMREQQPDAPNATASEICEAAKLGDVLAIRCVEREGYYIGLGLANLITIFAPDKIALGGGIMKSGPLFMDIARQVIRDICTQVPSKKTRIASASLGQDSVLLGAAQAWLLRHKR
ncbi:MAG TPA: ROK family protein [Alloacidobacterium sp.]|nr:ROK family protein [Alloacidobacterium sp.]